MRARSGRAALAAGLVLALAACSGGEEPSGAEEAPGSTSPTTPAQPSPAGSSLASLAAELPDGAADGQAVITYTGLGELRAPFTGECRSDGNTTAITGTADTASVTLTLAPDGSTLAVVDEPVRSESTLAEGDVTVTGNRLQLAVPLLQGGATVGALQLDLTCGG